MGLFSMIKRRADPNETYTDSQGHALKEWLACDSADPCTPYGYRTMDDTPEIKAAVEKIAEIISTMTIHLKQNSEMGDVRVVDGLSAFVDIHPSKLMNRQLLVSWIVQEMLLRGNAVVQVKTRKGYLDELIPLSRYDYVFKYTDKGYQIELTKTRKVLKPDSFLHFRFNPDLTRPYMGKSQEVILRDLINNLGQSNATVQDFMENQMYPTAIIKVDAMEDDMTSDAGRDEIEKRFIRRRKSGQPRIIPSLMDVQQMKPLTLNDIAIHDNIAIDKQAAASIIGVPAFMLGVGDFDEAEYNNFIKTKVAVICKAIEQELTTKLLTSPNLYFAFNATSMLSYSLQEMGNLYLSLQEHGDVTGNEVRDKVGLSPVKELTDFAILENYIPVDKIGDQGKLEGGDDGDNPVQGEQAGD